MKNRFFNWEVAGFLFVIIFGSLLHFVFQWSGENQIVGIFSPVNESTWEHLKMLFVSMLFFSVVEYFSIGKNFPNFIAAKSFGILLGILVVPIVFYTYTGIIGKRFLWADILTFILGAAAASVYAYRMVSKEKTNSRYNFVGLALLLLFSALFVLFTFSPPRINLFLDPVTQTYGIDSIKPVP